jgi:hypothetical protein
VRLLQDRAEIGLGAHRAAGLNVEHGADESSCGRVRRVLGGVDQRHVRSRARLRDGRHQMRVGPQSPKLLEDATIDTPETGLVQQRAAVAAILAVVHRGRAARQEAQREGPVGVVLGGLVCREPLVVVWEHLAGHQRHLLVVVCH